MLTGEIKNKLRGICEGGESLVAFDEDLSGHSWISIGGNASAWLVPSTLEGLQSAALLLRDCRIPFVVMGNASNVLIPDEGLDAVVINLSKGFFLKKGFEGQEVLAGAGVNLSGLISDCCFRGLAGMEGLVGIPATVGGALATNASYRTVISDHLQKVRVMDENGRVRWIKKEKLKFGYRSSSFSEREVIVEAVFSLDKKQPEKLREKLKKNFFEKMEQQPLGEKTLGCVFKNPENGRYRCGQLIESAMLKGIKRGGAQVSEKHANFIINNGNAKASDVIALIGDIRRKVREKFSIELETEIEILGA